MSGQTDSGQTFCGIADIAPNDEARLDVYIAEHLQIMRRSQLKKRITSAAVNGKKIKLSRLIKAGDMIELSWSDPPPLDLVPEDIPLDIIYEDDNVIVVNKQQGLVVHPGAGNFSGTLVNALLWHGMSCKKISAGTESGFGIERPFIVHRLDKDTSGVIIAAWNNKTLSFLADQFKERRVTKKYIAIVKGVPKEESGIIKTNLVRDAHNRKCFTVSEEAGKAAVTRYRVMRNMGAYSLLLLAPKTGRTHQLRVHLKFLGTPILGDPIYAAKDRLFPDAALMLHARKLTITLPDSSQPVTFKSAVPERFLKIIRTLDGA